jgi:hypothetical protein
MKPTTPAIIPKPPLTAGHSVSPIVPTDFESAYRLATVVHAAGMAPKSLDSIEKCTVAILHGLEVGLPPMAALQSIAIINGQPALYGDGLMALVRGSGLLEDIVETCDHDKDGPTIAVCKVKRRDQATWVQHEFTRPEAMRAGLWKKQGPWIQYPQRMMQMRARSWALRDAFADVLRGIRSAEEMLDITAAGNATTAPPEPRRQDYDAGENPVDGLGDDPDQDSAITTRK